MKAKDFFHKKPENFNCAQAVLKSWQNEFNISENLIAEFRKFGGGRSSNGLCGAIYATDYLLSIAGKSSVQNEFKNKLNYLNCLDLKREGKVSCEKCVATADELVAAAISS